MSRYREPLLVYGTLCRGGPAHRWLRGARYLGEARARIRVERGYSHRWPACRPVRQGGRPLRGELYLVPRRLLRRLDWFEEHPVRYRRRRVRLTDGRWAWAYLVEDRRLFRRGTAA